MSDIGTATADRIQALPLWSGDVDISRLEGGLSNESFTVATTGDRYVVRFGSDLPFHHVYREHEVMVAQAAYDAGFAPELIYAADGVMVSRFVDGETYDATAVRANLDDIADLVARFHQQMPRLVSGAARLFWPFHVIRDYARTITNGTSPHSAKLPELLALADILEGLQQPMPLVFGHHDFLPANFIHDGSRLWLIDFEYAAYSTAMFDLAGVLAHADVEPRAALAFLQRYFGKHIAPDALQALAAMQCAAFLREAMWSMVSELHMSAPGVDYAAYTQENFRALRTSATRLSGDFGIRLPAF